ncbi:MAG: 4Fe-4S binding protein [Chloroflexi bacterium]|nr:4Fe-4S binding protein [Chloroflexota bacterium]
MSDEAPATGRPESAPVNAERREFLKAAGASAAAVFFLGAGAASALARPTFPQMPTSAGVIMPDPSLCIGCLTCEVACSQVHLEAGMSGEPRIRIFNAPNVKLNPAIETHYPGRGTFQQLDCLMCPDAPCLPVCPVGAVQIDPRTHARVIAENLCIACGKCEAACPFPTRDEAAATNQKPNGQRKRIIYDRVKRVYTKCDLCSWRPEGPACVERCPVNVRIRQGVIQSKVLCLDIIPADTAGFEKVRAVEA